MTAPDPVLAYKRGAKRMSDRIQRLERENAGLERQNADLKEALREMVRRVAEAKTERTP